MLKILNQWALLACVSFSTTTFSADFIVIGDMPYGHGDKVEEGYRHLISSINSEDSAFVVHLGDIKSGSTLCNDQMYVKQKVFSKCQWIWKRFTVIVTQLEVNKSV